MTNTKKDELKILSALADEALEVYGQMYSRDGNLPDHRMALFGVKSCIEEHIWSPLGRGFPIELTKKGLRSHIVGSKKKDRNAMWDSIAMMEKALKRSKHLETSLFSKKPPIKGGLLLLENQSLAVVGHGALVGKLLDAPSPGRNALGICR